MGEEAPLKGGKITPYQGKLQSLLRASYARNHWVGETEEAEKIPIMVAQSLLFQEKLLGVLDETAGTVVQGQ